MGIPWESFPLHIFTLLFNEPDRISIHLLVNLRRFLFLFLWHAVFCFCSYRHIRNIGLLEKPWLIFSKLLPCFADDSFLSVPFTLPLRHFKLKSSCACRVNAYWLIFISVFTLFPNSTVFRAANDVGRSLVSRYLRLVYESMTQFLRQSSFRWLFWLWHGHSVTYVSAMSYVVT